MADEHTTLKELRLTHNLSYIIGFWKKLRSHDGIGVTADKERVQFFIELVIKSNLTSSDKIIIHDDGQTAYFYHTKLRTFFEKIVENELERFKYDNDYSANYFAGIYDAVGHTQKILSKRTGLTKNIIIIEKSNQKEELLFSRQNFKVKLKEGKLYVLNGDLFLNKYEKYFLFNKR
ncbi:MAG: hypothetical protein N3E37_01075 [Candidatus Micrarchaeota archaeon]|nr:hypothetical protein [Candidatus Micrarchaeota archaeon]